MRTKNKSMIKSRFLFLVLLALCVPDLAHAKGRCETGAPYPYEAPYEMKICPEDIQGWLDRANGCTYYESELENIDNDAADRSSVLKAHMVELECTVLWCDFDTLFIKYEGDLIFSDIITGYAQSLYGDSELPACDKGLKKRTSEE